MSSGAHFAVVDQAINVMKRVESYINVGMDTTVDVSLDLVENATDVSPKTVDELKDVMKDYVRMERDLKQFVQAVDYVRKKAKKAGDERLDLEGILDKKLEELQSENSEKQLNSHEKYTDLTQKIWDIQHPDEEMAMEQSPMDENEDVAMTQQEVITKCPYTGREMTIPVQNRICRHNYDRDGILDYLKKRGKKAKCPVSGCGNDKPMIEQDLQENKDLKRHIDRKNRKAGKRTKKNEKETAHTSLS